MAEEMDDLDQRMAAAGIPKRQKTGRRLLFRVPQLEADLLKAGDPVQVRAADGEWHTGFRIIVPPTNGEAWIVTESEWQQAQQEGRTPGGNVWPADQLLPE